MSTIEYVKALKCDVARCALCEIEFSQTVFELSDEQVEVLKEKWVLGEKGDHSPIDLAMSKVVTVVDIAEMFCEETNLHKSSSFTLWVKI